MQKLSGARLCVVPLYLEFYFCVLILCEKNELRKKCFMVDFLIDWTYTLHVFVDDYIALKADIVCVNVLGAPGC